MLPRTFHVVRDPGHRHAHILAQEKRSQNRRGLDTTPTAHCQSSGWFWPGAIERVQAHHRNPAGVRVQRLCPTPEKKEPKKGGKEQGFYGSSLRMSLSDWLLNTRGLSRRQQCNSTPLKCHISGEEGVKTAGSRRREMNVAGEHAGQSSRDGDRQPNLDERTRHREVLTPPCLLYDHTHATIQQHTHAQLTPA